MKKRRISITLNEDLINHYTEIAKQDGISRNALMAIALKLYINAKKYSY